MRHCVEKQDVELSEKFGSKTIAEMAGSAFENLYTEHIKAVYYLALRMTGDPALAEDVAHDVFLKAFRKFSEFRHESNPRTWLYRITINHCQNILKSWHKRHIVSGSEECDIDNVKINQDEPFKVIEKSELGELIQKTLDMLPEDYKTVLLLFADEQMSYQEIARITNQTPDAVRGKLYRARKLFAVHFKKLSSK